MLRTALLIIAILSLFTQKAPATKGDVPKPYLDREAYEIYSTILPSEWPWREANAKVLVIRRETKDYDMCLRPDKESEAIVGPAIADYVKKNESPQLLQQMFSIEKPYQLIAADDLDSLFKNSVGGGWEEFYRLYPNSGGYIEFSAVGFNKDRTVAVVYMGHGCGGLCGGGEFHVLEKKEGEWIPLEWKGNRCVWDS
jgi:hypothetical protein